MRFFILLLFSFFLYLPQLLKPPFKLHEPKMAHHSAWETPPPSLTIHAILSQPFTYLAHGNQVTVFASSDGQYVLKLFRYNRSRFPLLHTLKNFFHKKPKNDLSTKIQKTFQAAHLAATRAAPFTQVLYCHLNLTEHLLPTVQLHGHRTFTLPLDKARFVLQRKATPFAEALLSHQNDPLALQQMIASLTTLIQERSALGIRNADPNLAPNFGFIGLQAVELDFGNYRSTPPSPQDLPNYLHRLDTWLHKNLIQKVESTTEKK